VFIAGCEDGFLPYRRTRSRETDPAEERRLFYVALTRAREQLFLSWSRCRTIHGRKEKREISPFLRDIEEDLLCRSAPGRHPRRENVARQKRLF
jgi:DNA helicase-2/ATP-dependent DNA helicase PcrA